MKLGINLPQFGSFASRENIALVAQRAEQLGCDAVWVQERLLRPTTPRQPYDTMTHWPEAYRVVFDPIETLSYAAAVTQRIRLGTSVLDALFHSPVVLGRRLATLDRLSGGRLIIGLAQGWSEDEFQVVNVPPKRRGAGYEEFIAALRAVWGPDPVRFDGQFYHIPESEIGPKPVQKPYPPLLGGGFAPVAIQRIGRLGLGLNPALSSFDALAHTMQVFRAAAKEAGHDDERLPVIVRGNVMIGDAPIADDRRPLTGSLEQVQDDVRRLAGSGIGGLFVDFYLTRTPPDEQLHYLEALVKAAR